MESVAAMLERASEHLQMWRDSKGAEPLDEAVGRLVAVADGPNEKAERLTKVLDRIVAVASRGESDALNEIHRLATEAL